MIFPIRTDKPSPAIRRQIAVLPKFPLAVLITAALTPLSAQAVWEMTPEGYVAHIFASAELCRDRMPQEVEEGLKQLIPKLRQADINIEVMQKTAAYEKAYAEAIADLNGRPEEERIGSCKFDWDVYSAKKPSKKEQ